MAAKDTTLPGRQPRSPKSVAHGAPEQIVVRLSVRLSSQLTTSLDELVARGRFPTRAEAVRSAIESLVDQEHRRRVGAEIADGYLRIPQSDEDLAAATAAATRSIHDEPWD